MTWFCQYVLRMSRYGPLSPCDTYATLRQPYIHLIWPRRTTHILPVTLKRIGTGRMSLRAQPSARAVVSAIACVVERRAIFAIVSLQLLHRLLGLGRVRHAVWSAGLHDYRLQRSVLMRCSRR